MFKKAPNYFYKTAPAEKYEAVQNIREWTTEEVPENVPLGLKKFLKEVKEYKLVKHNFQQDIDEQIFYTPEQIQNNNIKLEPKNLKYQKEDIKNFNATDLRQAAKEIKNEAIQKTATQKTNEQIMQLQKKINELKNQQNQNQENKKENNK